MEKACLFPRRRMITGVICIFLCMAGAYNCLTHLFVYLDVLIFDLGMLIWDLVLFAGYVLLTVGAFKVNFILSGIGISVVTLMKIANIIKGVFLTENANVSEEIYALMAVDVAEVLGLLMGALLILSQLKPEGALKNTMKTIWFAPAVFFAISVVGSLFSNVGVLSDKTVTMLFLSLATVSYAVWCANPKGFVLELANRLKANENEL
ncbi:MAG: hypothetical protein IJD93_05050 [Ruminococcus sp.]|nr:hypothetical protein [Ruminococcus sp.]